eukprot:1029426-Amphidinium_carterae.1
MAATRNRAPGPCHPMPQYGARHPCLLCQTVWFACTCGTDYIFTLNQFAMPLARDLRILRTPSFTTVGVDVRVTAMPPPK